MPEPTPPDSRICHEVRLHLPALVAGELVRWRRRLIRLHLRRCAGCRLEREREERLALGFEALAVPPGEQDPPDGLLETLLEQAAQPDLRGRAAVPARGAVSGARPGLSAALLVAGALGGTAVGYAGWRAARRVARRTRRR